MKDIEFQNDFFGGGQEPKRPKNSGVLKKYSEQRFLPFIKIPLEYSIIIIIVFLVMMVVSYAVGVEKGRRIASRMDLTVPPEVFSGKETQKEPPLTEKSRKMPLDTFFWDEPGSAGTSGEESSLEGQENIAENVTVEEAEGPEKETGAESRYNIMAAAFRRKESALYAVEELKVQGHNAAYRVSGDWYQVYVTGYPTRGAAERDLLGLMEMYPDCYIRRDE